MLSNTVCIPAMLCAVGFACYPKCAIRVVPSTLVLFLRFLLPENRHTHQEPLVFTLTDQPSTERLSLA